MCKLKPVSQENERKWVYYVKVRADTHFCPCLDTNPFTSHVGTMYQSQADNETVNKQAGQSAPPYYVLVQHSPAWGWSMWAALSVDCESPTCSTFRELYKTSYQLQIVIVTLLTKTHARTHTWCVKSKVLHLLLFGWTCCPCGGNTHNSWSNNGGVLENKMLTVWWLNHCRPLILWTNTDWTLSSWRLRLMSDARHKGVVSECVVWCWLFYMSSFTESYLRVEISSELHKWGTFLQQGRANARLSSIRPFRSVQRCWLVFSTQTKARAFKSQAAR